MFVLQGRLMLVYLDLMKYYIIAGEASGDLHGSNLLKEIRKKDPSALARGFGGDRLEKEGMTIVKHFRDLAFMGFIEVIANLRTIIRNLALCKSDIENFRPDVLILVDYPGFNLRIAEWAHSKGIKIAYYISPQVWAWKENRVKLIRKVVDKMIVILPFENDFYKKWNYKVEYVGHPLVQVVDEFRQKHEKDTATDIIAVLPGSRQQEIKAKLPVMLRQAEKFPGYRFVVAMAPGLNDDFYAPLIKAFSNGNISTSRNTYSLLLNARAALVTSGTATLETALFGVPQVICYKGSNISYQIAKRLIKIRFIGLVNLIMDREVVKELIQHELNDANLNKELEKILHEPAVIEKIKNDYSELHQLLSRGGNASEKAAKIVVDMASSVEGLQ